MSGKIMYNKTFKFLSKKMEREKQDSYQSDLIIGIYHLKNEKFEINDKTNK